MGKGAKWTTQEDDALARAWVVVSEDPVTGNEQKSDSFWGLIHQNWSQCGSDRTVQALKNHWCTLQRCVQKFCGYLQRVEDLHRSGTTPTDTRAEALQMYLAIEKEVFLYEGAWIILKSCPKWSSKPPTPTPSAKRALPISFDEEIQTPPKRPGGVKQAKESKATERETSSSIRKLAESQANKNALFADHMLMTMLLANPTNLDNQSNLEKLKNKYLKVAFSQSSENF